MVKRSATTFNTLRVRNADHAADVATIAITATIILTRNMIVQPAGIVTMDGSNFLNGFVFPEYNSDNILSTGLLKKSLL